MKRQALTIIHCPNSGISSRSRGLHHHAKCKGDWGLQTNSSNLTYAQEGNTAFDVALAKSKLNALRILLNTGDFPPTFVSRRFDARFKQEERTTHAKKREGPSAGFDADGTQCK